MTSNQAKELILVLHDMSGTLGIIAIILFMRMIAAWLK